MIAHRDKEFFGKKLNLKWKRGAEYPATWFRSGRFAYLQNLWMIIMRLMEFMIVETWLCQNGIDLHVTFYLAHGIWFGYGSLSWQLCSAKRALKDWRIFYAWLLRKYVTHPAGTSDRHIRQSWPACTVANLWISGAFLSIQEKWQKLAFLNIKYIYHCTILLDVYVCFQIYCLIDIAKCQICLMFLQGVPGEMLEIIDEFNGIRTPKFRINRPIEFSG